MNHLIDGIHALITLIEEQDAELKILRKESPMAQDYNAMSLEELLKLNQDLGRQADAIKKERSVINGVAAQKRHAEQERLKQKAAEAGDATAPTVTQDGKHAEVGGVTMVAKA